MTAESMSADALFAQDPVGSRRAVLRAGAVGAVAAASLNIVLWVAGKIAGADFLVDAGGGDTKEVGLLAVIVTTVVVFALGSAVLVAVHRTHLGPSLLIGAAVLLALVSTGGPLSGGEDTATSALLAAMHLVTGAAFVLTVMSVRRR